MARIELPQITARSVLMEDSRVQYVLVGCGGTGAWLAPLLGKIARPGDKVVFVDHDVVEERNTRRQAFRSSDAGHPKSEVMALRYAPAMPDGVEVVAYQAKFSRVSAEHPGRVLVLLGCVDNRQARVDMRAWAFESGVSAYLDCGNETRGGQVVLTLHEWPLIATGPGARSLNGEALNYNLDGLREIVPELLDPSGEVAGPGCAERIDLQTPAANHLAASLAFSMLAGLIDQIPFTHAGVFYSTLGTTRTVPLVGVVTGALGDSRCALTTVR